MLKRIDEMQFSTIRASVRKRWIADTLKLPKFAVSSQHHFAHSEKAECLVGDGAPSLFPTHSHPHSLHVYIINHMNCIQYIYSSAETAAQHIST